jgi:excinuclease ABC subunit B
LDFFPQDFLVVLDESHVAVPQLRGQYAGDRSRKETLVDHGFRLPSAMDNRPLRFEEFMERTGQIILLSATPGPWEMENSTNVVEQVIRPTGLVDPEVDIVPTTGQIDDLRERIDATVAKGYRVLVTTLTKKMAEDLTDYLSEQGVRVQYLHSDVDTMARIELLRELRLGVFDVLVGINLLREGLDLPEVALVAILDADKEGFLRSASSLIQTMGRAARNVDGRVVMYADRITYNLENGIDPVTITKSVTDILERVRGEGIGSAAVSSGPNSRAAAGRAQQGRGRGLDPRARAAEMADEIGPDADQLSSLIHRLDAEMNRAAEELRFEEAALLRDEINELRSLLVRDPVDGSAVLPGDTADIEATADV